MHLNLTEELVPKLFDAWTLQCQSHLNDPIVAVRERISVVDMIFADEKSDLAHLCRIGRGPLRKFYNRLLTDSDPWNVGLVNFGDDVQLVEIRNVGHAVWDRCARRGAH